MLSFSALDNLVFPHPNDRLALASSRLQAGIAGSFEPSGYLHFRWFLTAFVSDTLDFLLGCLLYLFVIDTDSV